MNTTVDSPIKESLKSAMKEAMKAKEKLKLETVRMALAAIKQIEIDDRIDLSDIQVIQVLTKLIKQRTEAIAQYIQAGRTELAEKEKQEIVILTQFLPRQLSADEVKTYIDAAFAEITPSGMKDMGKVMNVLKPQLEGKADLAEVSKLVKAKLT
jgi:uncharacterized protein YqeY